MNFKKIISLALLLTILGTSSVFGKTMEFTIDDTSILISDAEISEASIDSAPYILNDRTMVPARVISETFQKEVLWDGATQTVTIKSDDKEIKLVIGSTEATVDGEVVTLDVAPQISNDRTMIPLRFVSEVLGYDVTYVDVTRQVLISDKSPALIIGDKKLTTDIIKAYCYTPDYSQQTVKQNAGNFINQIQLTYLMAISAQLNNITLDDSEKEQIKIESQAVKKSGLLPGIYADFVATTTLAEKFFEQRTNFTDEELNKYYRENFMSAKHILFATFNQETSEPLSDKEKEAVKATADGVLKDIKAGGQFDEYMAKHSADESVFSSPEGSVFKKNETVAEFENAVINAKDNEVCDSLVESVYGYHIIKRLPLPEPDEALKQQIREALSVTKLPELFADVMDVEIKTLKSTDEIVSDIMN